MGHNPHPLFFAPQALLNRIKAVVDILTQQAPIGIVVRLVFVIAEVAEAQRQPVTTAKRLLLNTPDNLLMHPTKQLIVFKH